MATIPSTNQAVLFCFWLTRDMSQSRSVWLFTPSTGRGHLTMMPSVLTPEDLMAAYSVDSFQKRVGGITASAALHFVVTSRCDECNAGDYWIVSWLKDIFCT